MNLNLAHALLVAADGQRHGFLKVRSADLVREVEQMTAAGLVEGSVENQGCGGVCRDQPGDRCRWESFLRAFKHEAPPPRPSSVSAEPDHGLERRVWNAVAPWQRESNAVGLVKSFTAGKITNDAHDA